MAEVIESVLGDDISGGVVNVPSSLAHSYQTGKIELHGASHPLPNEAGVAGVEDMLQLVDKPSEDTLVICLISGGGSALMPLPAEGLTLQDKIETTDLLLKSGANIQEMNVVRKHLSGIKGGRLAERLYPCNVIAFMISDIVGNPLDMVASGPLFPDRSTFKDALEVLKKFDLEDKVPISVKNILRAGVAGKVRETPKPNDIRLRGVHHFMIGSNMDACRGAYDQLKSAGCDSFILTSSLTGEAKDRGRVFAEVSRDFTSTGLRSRKRKAFVIGGETTVVVRGPGLGGRNQEAALAAAIELDGVAHPTVVACIGTDGMDGPTTAAGALADELTSEGGRRLGLNPRRFLLRNDSNRFFKKAGGLILTGPTGTNVNDVWVSVRG
jgi:hydroxypyruvate reductase